LPGRSPVIGRTALDDIADEQVVPAGKTAGVTDLVEQLPGPADKRTPLFILIPTRRFTDHHDRCLLITFTEDNVPTGSGQPAFRAAQYVFLEIDDVGTLLTY